MTRERPMTSRAGADHADLGLARVRRTLAGHRATLREGERRAAVAAIFRDGEGGTDVLLIHRAEHPLDPWSGHVAFPGGRVDPTDASPRHAAVRETREEIGLDLERQATPLGRLSDLGAVARGRRLGLVIEPFAYELVEDGPLTLNEEVQEAFWLPLSHLVERSNRSTMDYDRRGTMVALPCYHWHGHLLWGLTLRILDEVVEILTGVPPTDWPEIAR